MIELGQFETRLLEDVLLITPERINLKHSTNPRFFSIYTKNLFKASSRDKAALFPTQILILDGRSCGL